MSPCAETSRHPGNAAMEVETDTTDLEERIWDIRKELSKAEALAMLRTNLSLDKIKLQTMTSGERLSAADRSLIGIILQAVPLARLSTHATLFILFISYLRVRSLECIRVTNLNNDTACALYAWKAEVVLTLIRGIIQERQKIQYSFDALRYSISTDCCCGTIRNRCDQDFDKLRDNERRIRASEERFLSEMSRLSASPIIVETLRSTGVGGHAEGSCALWEVLRHEIKSIPAACHIELPDLALPSNVTLLGGALQILCRKGAVANKSRGEKAADLGCGTRWL